MPKKDFEGFVAVVGESLKEFALEHKARMKADEPLDQGVLMGYALALDRMWDYLEMFNFKPDDLNWKDFESERNLLGHPGQKPSRTRQ